MKTQHKIKAFFLSLFFLYGSIVISQSTLKSFAFVSDSLAETGPVLLTNEGYVGSINTYKNGNGNYFIYKNDLIGNLVWSKEISLAGLSSIHDISSNSSGQLFFIGDNTVADADYSLFSTNANGTVLWTVNLPKNSCVSYDESPKIKNDNDGNLLIVTCTYEKTLVYKLTPSGVLIWSKVFYSDSVTWENPSFDFEITPNNGLLIIGRAKDDMCITNLDENGNLVFYNKYHDYDNYNTHPRAIQKLNDGNYLIAGFKGENFSPYRFGFYLAKINSTGDVLDYRFYFDTTLTHMFVPYMICEKSNGNLLIAGDGGYLSFAEMDQNLNLLKYEYYSPLANVQTFPGSYSCLDNQLMVAFGNRDKQIFNFRTQADSLECCGLNTCTGFDFYTFSYSASNITNDITITGGITNTVNTAILSSVSLPVSVLECGTPEYYLGLPTAEILADLSVYPNPVAQNGFIHVNNIDDGGFDYSIYSIDGKLQVSSMTYNGIVAINNLEKGNYLLQINTVSGKFNSIITVQ